MSSLKILELLRKYYHESVFDIEYDQEHKYYVVSRNLIIPHFQTGEPEDRKINCIEIFMDDDKNEILIKSILTCSVETSAESIGKGRDIIRRIVQFATNEYPSYKLIVEYDVSRITIHGSTFPLGGIKLLTTGQTWYNSLGFYEKGYEENTQNVKQYTEEYQDKRKKITVKQFFTEIWSKIMDLSKKKDLTEEEMDYIKKMNTKIKNKVKSMDNELHLHAKDKYSNLVFRGAPRGGRRNTRRTRKNIKH